MTALEAVYTAIIYSQIDGLIGGEILQYVDKPAKIKEHNNMTEVTEAKKFT